MMWLRPDLTSIFANSLHGIPPLEAILPGRERGKRLLTYCFHDVLDEERGGPDVVDVAVEKAWSGL